MANIEIDSSAENISVAVRLYTDDLERALQIYSDTLINIINIEDNMYPKGVLESYINNNLKISCDQGQCFNLRLDTVINEVEALRILLYAEEIKKSTNFVIESTLLNELYSDQVNLLIVGYQNFQEGYTLTHENSTIIYSLP